MPIQAQMMMYGSCKIPHNINLQTLWIGEKATLESTNGNPVSMLLNGEKVSIEPGYYSGDIRLVVQ